MTDLLKDLDAEPLSVGRIGVSEAQGCASEGRDRFAERVEQRITELLAKYDCVLAVTEFRWMNGQGGGKITVIRKPSAPTE